MTIDSSDEVLVVNSPLYLLRHELPCYACSSPVTTVAIATTHLIDPNYDPDELLGEVCLLSNLSQLPAELLAAVQMRQPFYLLRYSQTVGEEYFMTICQCGAHQGDFFVQKAMFNAAAHDPDQITAEKLNVTGSWAIPGGYSTSSAYEPLIANL